MLEEICKIFRLQSDQFVFILTNILNKILYEMAEHIWLTENISNTLNRQVGDESGNEGVLEERHVLERVGGVQQTGHCREQIGYQIHLWNDI